MGKRRPQNGPDVRQTPGLCSQRGQDDPHSPGADLTAPSSHSNAGRGDGAFAQDFLTSESKRRLAVPGGGLAEHPPFVALGIGTQAVCLAQGTPEKGIITVITVISTWDQ